MNHLKLALAVSTLSLFVGCATKLDPVKISSYANPAEEIALQYDLIARAQADQVDVLAHKDFSKAKKYLSEATEDHKDGEDSSEVLESLGYSKAYLNNAVRVASAVRNNLPGVIAAREVAIKAGARYLQNDLDDLDSKMKRLALQDDKDIDPADKLSLQSKYIDLELKSIRYVKLNRVKNLLAEAKDKDALSIAPKSYAQALYKYNIAEQIIKADPHNEEKIIPAVNDATVSATRVLILLEAEEKLRNQTPEKKGMLLEARDLALARAIAASSEELKPHERYELIVNQAAAQFNKDEIDVFRQSDQVIIRLNSINFASGSADLSANSIAILTKVKNMIKELGPTSVMVQGHADALGDPSLNQKLSEERAESVVDFFSSDNAFDKNFLDSIGYGSAKPLGPNRTKEDRAKNRRIDIVITPPESM